MGAQAVRLSNIDIDNALKNKDFEVLFQPIFDLGNGALARVETFLRWRHPSLGILPPGAFISFFESQGRMGELTRYVLSEAIDQYKAWRGASAPGFSINLAMSDLADEAFSSHFAVLLRDSGFPADLITLECPMPPVTMDVETASAHFRRLSGTGARLAIEVRGRANDFLRQIEPFPFDEIKTGGSAILRFARTVRGPGLSAISELLDIASKANAAITAVGVEDQASLAALRGLGFAAAQGNHLGKVGTLGEFTPSRVNDVRSLLGLEPLADEDLQALFRTEAPAPQQAAADQPAPAPAPEPAAPGDDDLVERLAARLARQSAPAEAPASDEPVIDKKAAKAAAIARAKRKAAALTTDEEQSATAANAGALAAARSLQERLSREFSEMSDDDAASKIPAAEAPPAREHVSVEGAETPKDAMSDKKNDARPGPAAAESAETAPAAREPAADTPQAEQAAPPEKEPLAASLAVGETFAYFRPGLRVRGVMPHGASEPVRRPAAQAEAPAASPAPRREPPPAAALQPDQTEGHEEEDVGIEWEGASETTDVGDAAQTEAEVVIETPTDELQESPAPRKSRKNFLTRRYRLWPTHFWPKSMKRAWRRRKQDAQRRRLERENESLGE